MNDEFKFLLVEKSDGKKIILNFDQIVGVEEVGGGCSIITTDRQFMINLNMSIKEFYKLLPGGLKAEEINK
jgi:hypothetical protein